MQVPFFSLIDVQKAIYPDLMTKLQEVMERKDYILGKEVTEFENEFARLCQTPYCVGVANGLDALKIALRSLNIGAGDEVIVPAHTYIASIFAIIQTGAKPVLIEPDPITYNITAVNIGRAITANTKAVMPVHLYGQACSMASIVELARKHNIYIVEDNAQAQGATFNGKVTGSFGDINATSFYPSKNLGAMGDAGAITTNNEKLAAKARVLRNVGCEVKYHHLTEGYNSRLDTLQAAVLNTKIPHLASWNSERQTMAARYFSNLKNTRGIILPGLIESAEHVYHLFVIRHAQRDKLQQHLQQQGVQTLIHYPVPPHLQPALAHLGYKKGDLPVTEEISETCLSLPLFTGISTAQVDYVSEQIISFTKNTA